MIFTELGESDKHNYNHFVAQDKSGSFLQSWEWGQWQESLGKKAFRFAVTEEGHPPPEGDPLKWLGCGQVLKMPLFKRGYFIYFPYGPVGNVDLKFWVEQMRKKFPQAVLMRVEPRISNCPSPSSVFIKSTNIQPGRTLLLNLHASSDKLLSDMHPKTRYNIKVAQRHGVEVEREFDLTVGHGLFFDEAVNLIVETATRQKYRSHPKFYYENLINFFTLKYPTSNLRVSLYKAKYQNKVLASAIMVDFGSIRTYVFGGSSDEFRNVMAPYALHWQAISDAKNQGLSFYDFDGLETSAGKHAQFARFKQGFGGFVETYPGAYDIIFHKLWYTMYRIARKINRLIRS